MISQSSPAPYASSDGESQWLARGRGYDYDDDSRMHLPPLRADEIDWSRAPRRNDLAFAIVNGLFWTVMAFWLTAHTLRPVGEDDFLYDFDLQRGLTWAALVGLTVVGLYYGARRLFKTTARRREGHRVSRLEKVSLVVIHGVGVGAMTFVAAGRGLPEGSPFPLVLGVATGLVGAAITAAALSFVVDVPPQPYDWDETGVPAPTE